MTLNLVSRSLSAFGMFQVFYDIGIFFCTFFYHIFISRVQTIDSFKKAFDK